MEERELKHLYPTLEMLAEELNLASSAFAGRGALRARDCLPRT